MSAERESTEGPGDELRPSGSLLGEESAAEFEPLPDDWEEQASSLAQSFTCPREMLREDRALLVDFAHLCLRFGYMEERVQGSILCELPAHLAVIRGDHPTTLLEEAEHLARVERGNLKLPEGPIEDLADLLDTRGIKVIEWSQPPARHTGAFLFHPRTGPALLCLAPVASPTGRAILSHEYCHLLADVDPYENRLCPQDWPAPHGRTGQPLTPQDSAEDLAFDDLAIAELRAELFARAFLLPGDHCRRTLTMFGIRPGRAIGISRLEDVAFYYGVEVRVVVQRMVDLGILPPAEAQLLLGETTADRRIDAAAPLPDPTATDQRLYPSPATRFVNLSLTLFLKHRVSLDQMAVLLGINQAAARRFVAWSEPSPEEAEMAPQAPRRRR